MADHWRDFDVHYAKTIELKMIAKWGLMKWITRVVATLRKLPFVQMMCLDFGQNIWGIWRLSIVCTPNIFELLTCWPLFSRPQAETNKSSFRSEQFSFDILNLNMNRLIQVSRSWRDWCLKRCSLAKTHSSFWPLQRKALARSFCNLKCILNLALSLQKMLLLNLLICHTGLI